MSRKHNVKHNRGRSNYKRRLEARGLSKTPRMSNPCHIKEAGGKK